MSVLARPQWFSPPARLQQGPAELSPLSATSAGSPSGGEGDSEGNCSGYGGSLIMVQHECSVDTERAAEAEALDEERLCSVVLDPLPSALLQSLGARGHVRMLRPPAAATSWPLSPSPPPAPQEDHEEDVRGIVHDLVSAVVSDASATQWAPQEPLVAPPSPVNEHRHRKKHRKARRESHDSEGRRKRRKRSTSSSSGSYCTTPGPGSEVKTQSTARVNPIFVWVTQSEESTITKVLCEDYDKRNRIRLTKTPNGWRAIPRTERLTVLQPTVPQEESARSPSPDPEISLDLSPVRNTTPSSPTHEPSNELFTPTQEEEAHEENNELCDDEDELVLRFDEDHEDIEMTEDELQADHEPESNESESILEKSNEEIINSESFENINDDETRETKIDDDNKLENEIEDECDEVLETKVEYELTEKQEEKIELYNSNINMETDDSISDDTMVPVLIYETILKIEPETLEGEPLKSESEVLDMKEIITKPEKIRNIETEILNLVPKKLNHEIVEDVDSKNSTIISEKDLQISSDGEKTPPPAHASSISLKTEAVPEPAADLSSNKRVRRLSGLLPCRSPLRLPPLQARPLPSPLALNGGDRRTPSPAHRQLPCVPPPKSALCGTQTPTPAHQHERHSPFLETLLSQKPLALESKRPSASFDPPPKRRRSEDITLRTLLGGAGQTTNSLDPVAPRSRLLELLTTSPPPRKPSTENIKRKQPTPLTIPTPPQPSAPQDALSELRQVLAEVQVPDPLLVPRSRLASLLASPAAEIPRLVRSPPISAPDTLAVSLSRLQALLRRPDSELLAWAAQDWAIDPTLKPSSKPQVIPKVPVTKPKLPVAKPVQKHSVVTPPSSSSLPWWLPASKPSSAVLPPSPDILAAFHAMYGSAMLPPSYFAPSFPHELSVWPGFANEAVKPMPPLHRPPAQEVIKSPVTPAVNKPRIACKSLIELLATKPKEPTEVPALDLAPPPAPSKHVDRRHHHHNHHHHHQQQQQQQTRDSRLWHPLFGSQKSDAWNWRPLTVHGD